MLAHDSICICICWYLHLLLEMWKSKEMLRELFDICKGVLVASAASWSCFLEGMVLQCLVYLNECCIKGYKKCGFLCLCFPNLFKPFPRSLALACSTTKLSCLVQALRLGKSHPSYLLGYLVFEAYPFCLLWWSTVPHPFQAETPSASLYLPVEILLHKSLLHPPKLITSTNLHYAVLLLHLL